MLHDKHQNKRGNIENCESCRFYFPTPAGNNGNCHRFPPTQPSGHMTTYPLGWCGEYVADKIKIQELGEDHFQKREREIEEREETNKKLGERMRKAMPPLSVIASIKQGE